MHGYDSIKRLYCAGVLDGNDHAFLPESLITRAEASAIVARLVFPELRLKS